MKHYLLYLKDGTKVPGAIVKNSMIKEKVWRTSDSYIFEDQVRFYKNIGNPKKVTNKENKD